MSGLRRWLFVLVMGVGGVSLAIGLGVWQLQRLAWKTALIAELEARLEDPAFALTGDETDALNFAPAVATGRFAQAGGDAGDSAEGAAGQLRFLSSLRPHGPGFRIVSPFVLENGARIMVDRGFAPESVAPRSAPIPPPPAGAMTIEGVLHWPREVSTFTPEPNLEDRLVFARDVPAMAEILDARPVLLVARETAAAEGAEWPRPLPPSVDLPNDHLGYAITWFSLAGVWAAMTGYFVLRRRRA